MIRLYEAVINSIRVSVNTKDRKRDVPSQKIIGVLAIRRRSKGMIPRGAGDSRKGLVGSLGMPWE